MDNLQGVFAKVLSDKHFCEELLIDPSVTLRKNGVKPTKEIIHALKGLDVKEIQKLAKAYGQGERGAM